MIVPSKTLTEPQVTPTIETSSPDFSTTSGIVTSPLPGMQSPIVAKKLKKYAIVNGRSFRLQIPEDTFFDSVDGNTR